MGVHGLWELLAPVGRRVSVETLAGKKLAIDASIWMVQFLKAMRDEKGEMIRNAHLLGFFRRICKLLFLRTKPVFVFDGGTPALKRRTLASRRRHRDNAQAKIRKTAEKLLLNHLKVRKLEELAAEIKNSRRQDDLKGKRVVNESKGKQVLSSGEESGVGGNGGGHGEKAGGGSTQESLDELLAASLAAEEERKFYENESASAGDGPSVKERDDDDDDDFDDDEENEEMIFPIANGKIDPTVLASLPPSMQLDLLVQMRERVMAENRQKYQKIKKAPAKFSEIQIQSYLRTVAFRREIDEVQKYAAGRGLGGVQTSRIASEANREFIFSSSFTGDKQMLTSKGVEKSGNVDHHALQKPMISDPVNCNSFASQPKSATEVSVGELIRDFGPDVETYCDERGRVRVSRVRGLGMHMTRDLQRNLDMMKEYEQEEVRGESCKEPELANTKEVPNVSKSLSENCPMTSACMNDETNSTKNMALILEEENHHFDGSSILGNNNAIEITFLEDDSGMKDTDDNLFLHLVSGRPTSKLFDGSSHPDRSTSESESDCIWEEGLVEGNAGSQKSDHKESQSFLAERNNYEEDEVDWEDGVCHVPKVTSPRKAQPEKAVSIGLLEEEADIQEAIRRSLEDFEKEKSSIMTLKNQSLGKSSEDGSFVESFFENSTLPKNTGDTNVPLESHIRSLPLCAIVDEHGQYDNASRKDVLQMTDSGKKHLSPSTSSGVHFDRKLSVVIDSKDNESGRTLYQVNVPSVEPVDGHLSQIEGCLDTSDLAKNEHSLISTNDFAETSDHINVDSSSVPDAVLSAAHCDDHAASQLSPPSEKCNNGMCSQKSTLVEEAVDNNGKEPEQVIEKNSIPDSFKGKTNIRECSIDHMELSESNLDTEISFLRQEHINLGNEQRKLERNAETASSEMFAECQELLQMFGLPYIIAPMEAEAQCAYMEMTNLVDGVVTDDSDVFLFGARSVYKNIFDDRKYVETYFMKDIESELGLNREKLIRMALLLGSDYTEGVSGIGIVNAIEVVHAFPEEDGLKKFREWIESPDPAILEKLDSHTGGSSRKRSSKAGKEDAHGIRKNVEVSAFEGTISEGRDDQPSVSGTQDIKDVFMSKHRNVSKNWHIPPSFPSESVITAYASPQVDESTEPFSWGKPDLVLLRKLCWERFGWGNQKADELLLPVLNEYNKHETQLRLEAFFTFNERFAKIRSQRIKKALKGITNTCSSDLTDDLAQEGSSSRRKRRLSSSITEGDETDSCSNAKIKRGSQVSKQPGKQNTESENTQLVDVAAESVILDESGRRNRIGLNKNVRGSGRGKGKGRGKGSGRSEDKLNYEPSNDTDCTIASESHTKIPETTSEVRRSMRPRKHVKYAEEILEVDELNVSSNQMDENDLHEAAVEHRVAEEDGSGTIRDSILDIGGSHPEKNLSSDYLSRGGGFCMDESYCQGDAFLPADSHMQSSADKEENWVGEALGLDGGKENPLKDNISKDYLHGGGGFCMDESDLQGETSQPAANLVVDSVGPLGETSCVSEDAQSLDLGCISGQGKKRVSEEPVLHNLSPVHGEVKPGLSAMPSLRRKRRKL